MNDSPCELRILHSASADLAALPPDGHEIVLADDRMLTAAAAVVSPISSY